jgi:hypothetical protein
MGRAAPDVSGAAEHVVDDGALVAAGEDDLPRSEGMAVTSAQGMWGGKGGGAP